MTQVILYVTDHGKSRATIGPADEQCDEFGRLYRAADFVNGIYYQTDGYFRAVCADPDHDTRNSESSGSESRGYAKRPCFIVGLKEAR